MEMARRPPMTTDRMHAPTILPEPPIPAQLVLAVGTADTAVPVNVPMAMTDDHELVDDDGDVVEEVLEVVSVSLASTPSVKLPRNPAE
jgi:hypothetical protein